jgi:hypothetical protein
VNKAARQPIRRGHQQSLKFAPFGGIAQPIQGRPIKTRSTVAIISI